MGATAAATAAGAAARARFLLALLAFFRLLRRGLSGSSALSQRQLSGSQGERLAGGSAPQSERERPFEEGGTGGGDLPEGACHGSFHERLLEEPGAQALLVKYSPALALAPDELW